MSQDLTLQSPYHCLTVALPLPYRYWWVAVISNRSSSMLTKSRAISKKKFHLSAGKPRAAGPNSRGAAYDEELG